MNSSILNDVKKIIGIEQSYEIFDQDLIIHINTIFMVLNQLGIGKEGFFITDEFSTWEDFVDGDKQLNLYSLKTYVGLRVRLILDPPTSSILKDSIDATIRELEYRLYITENFNE